MSQTHENGSRLDQIEALMLQLATASIRHDNEFSRFHSELDRINATLDRVSEQQAANARQIEATERQAAVNQENIQTLTASIQELRNLMADYIQGRSQS